MWPRKVRNRNSFRLKGYTSNDTLKEDRENGTVLSLLLYFIGNTDPRSHDSRLLAGEVCRIMCSWYKLAFNGGDKP